MNDMKVSGSDNVVATFPASITQKRTWFMEQIHPGDRGLIIALHWELRGSVTSDAVERAFQTITDRHEVFRTRFRERDGEPVQEVLAHVDFRLARLDLRNVPEADRARKISEIASEHAGEPFDMGRAGLIRVAMVQTGPDRAALLIAVHNSVFDGYSIGVLGHELGTLLEAEASGQPAELPELALQYGDFAMWQADYAASGAFAGEEAYWAQKLGGMACFEIPPDRPRSPGPTESRNYARDLPADFEPRLAGTAKALETSLFTLGTTAFAVALERFTGRRDVSFAIQAAGRNEVDLEPLIGIFTNPMVLRFDIDPEAPLSDHARAARDIINGALAHQMLPFDRVVQVLNPPRDPLRIPLVSIMFGLQPGFLKTRRYGAIELVPEISDVPGTLYDLNVNIAGHKTGWRLVIDYNARLFDEATIARFAALLVEVLDSLMHHAERPVGTLRAETEPRPEARPETAAGEAPLAVAPSEAAEEGTAEGAATIESLRAIWSDVLAIPADSATGNFFDLGGHSILALRMLAMVAESFGQRPSIQAFLADPTLEGLAGVLNPPAPSPAPQTGPAAAPDTAPNPIWDLTELRASSADAPVLIAVNQPFMFHALAREMVADCAVASLSVPGAAELQALEQAGLDKAIEAALAPVLARYAGRPLMFCGLCVDGLVALRLAQRLRDEGQNTALVAMIDSWAPGSSRAFSRLRKSLDRWHIRFRRIGYYLGLRRQGEIGWTDVLRQNDLAAGIIARLTGVPAKNETETLVDDTVEVLVGLTRGYRFAPYDGEVVLFITRSQAMVPKDGVLGWSGLLAADVTAYPVNGWHGDALMRSGFERIIGVLDVKAQRLRRATPPG